MAPINGPAHLWPPLAWLLAAADRVYSLAVRLLYAICRYLFTVSPLRAGLESALVMALLFWLVLVPMQSAPDVVIPATFLLFSLVSGSIAGLRARLLPGNWILSLLREALLSIPLALLLALVSVGVLWLGGSLWLFQKSILHPAGTLLVTGMSIPACLTLRALARLGSAWNLLRQRRFLWALTHAQLTVVVLLGALLMLAGLGVIAYTVHIELNDLASLPGNPPYSVFMQVIIWLLGLALLTLLFIGLGILILFPIALLFSYLVGRGLTRRVETLAQAAARLREGDLAARVRVEGQDELGQLQASFNAMVADLEQRTLELEARTRDLEASESLLKAERDRTAGLLSAHRELTATVSHELRTPVATARTYLDALLEHPQTLENASERQHDLMILSSEIDRLERLIDDLFTLSRAEVDRLSLAIVPVAIRPLLARLVETVEKPAWEQRRVQVMLEDGEPLTARADPARLEQIIRNLLQNSLRHTPPGGYVLVSAGQAGAWVCLQVEDSGEGIDPADLPHVWERFYRSDSARLAGEGSGLGLALVRELAEAMGGQVGVETVVGEGSRFWVKLPGCAALAPSCDTTAT